MINRSILQRFWVIYDFILTLTKIYYKSNGTYILKAILHILQNINLNIHYMIQELVMNLFILFM